MILKYGVVGSVFLGAMPALIAVLAALSLAPPAAQAAACTAPGPPRSGDSVARWVGVTKSVAATRVLANLEDYSTYVESNNVLGFVQLVDETNDKWAKMGHIKSWSGSRSIYSEAKYSGTVQFNSWAFQSGTHTYEVDYSSGSFLAIWDGTTKTTWGATASPPSLSQILGETRSLSDQMLGDTSNKMSFDNAQNFVSGSWQDFNGSAVNSNSTVYGLTGVSTRAFDIWDKDC